MKNVFIWIGVAFIIAATIIGQFTGIPGAQWLELAGFAIGLASCIVGIVSKAEKKDWKLYITIFGITVGSMLLVFAGVTEDKVKTLISLIAGVAALIISILPAFIKKKE